MPDSTAILTDFMLPPQLSAAAAVILGWSVAVISDTAGLYLFRRRDGIFRGLYFFSGLLCISWIVLLMSISGIAGPATLRGLGGGAIICGAVTTWSRRNELQRSIRLLRGQSGARRLAIFGVVLLLIALSPPTDADSLDYHLGVPVHVLRTGALDFDAFQLHYPMFGFGEMLNLLGLANGAASFGAMVQLLALGWLLLAYRDFLPEGRLKPAAMLVLGIPVLISLIPGSKHLLTGACCTAVCFLYFLKHGKKNLVTSDLPAFSALLFATGIKYSFLISGFLLVIYAMWQGNSRLYLKLSLATGLAILFYVPLVLFKLHRFYDPVAPFGLGTSGRDPVATWFCDFIRGYRESAFPFPLSVLFPSDFGAVSTVLGWGFVVLLLGIVVGFNRYRTEVLMITTLCVLTMTLGQKTSRFFIEPVLWMLPLWLRLSCRYRWTGIVTRIGKLQFFLTLPLSLYLAWSLGRGVISGSQQNAVMSRNGSFYEPATWVNAIVPHNAMLLTDIRSRSLLRMPVFPIEYHYARNAGPDKLRVVDSLLAHRYGVGYIAVIDPDVWFVKKYCAELVAGPKTFLNATRNPFNRGTFTMVIYRAKQSPAFEN